MTTPLTKRRVVLDLAISAPAHLAMYGRPDDDAESNVTGLPVIYLTAEDFRALGEREQITITIEPGDQLTEVERNADAEPAQCAEMIALRGEAPVRCERDNDHGGMHWSNAGAKTSTPKTAI